MTPEDKILKAIDARLKALEESVYYDIHLESSYTLPSSNAVIPLKDIEAQRGEGLTYSTSTYTFTATRKMSVMASAAIYITSGLTSGDAISLTIWKNSTVMTEGAVAAWNSSRVNVQAAPVIIDLNAGDTIKVQARNSTSARGLLGNMYGSYVTIMEI